MRMLLALVIVGCGTDVRPPSQDDDPGEGDAPRPDARGPTIVADAQAIPPDGLPANLTPCEEAVYHSDLAWIQEHVFDASCQDGCHAPPRNAAGLNLTAGSAHAALVGVPSTGHAGWVRVAPGQPAASMLLVQLGGEPGPELEGFMPWGEPRLCTEMIDAIRRWIAAGAPEI